MSTWASVRLWCKNVRIKECNNPVYFVFKSIRYENSFQKENCEFTHQLWDISNHLTPSRPPPPLRSSGKVSLSVPGARTNQEKKNCFNVESTPKELQMCWNSSVSFPPHLAHSTVLVVILSGFILLLHLTPFICSFYYIPFLCCICFS